MPRELVPSLRALRAFTATARHLSFTRGAEELGLTQSAVSFQVKNLEDTIGVKLFDRGAERLSLTTAGDDYLKMIIPALQDLAEATATARGGSDNRTINLRISVFRSFATRWLMPRLGEFLERRPEITLDIEASNRIVDLDAGEADIAIRYGAGNWNDVDARLLMTDVLYPVCTPDMADRLRIQEPEDLRRAPLLGDETCDKRNDGWRLWFAAARLGDQKQPKCRCVFNDSGLLVQAVLDGQGVGLGRHSLVFEELGQGKLVRLTSLTLANAFGYYVCWPKSRRAHLGASPFLEWLQEKAQEIPPIGAVEARARLTQLRPRGTAHANGHVRIPVAVGETVSRSDA